MCDIGLRAGRSPALLDSAAGGRRLLFRRRWTTTSTRSSKTYLKDPVAAPVARAAGLGDHDGAPPAGDRSRGQDQLLTAELASRDGRTIVFVRTKLGADRVATQFGIRGVMAAALHGGLTQGVRDPGRSTRSRTVPSRVLVATDVAARGIHVDDVGLVVQADPPAEHKDYLHRARSDGARRCDRPPSLPSFSPTSSATCSACRPRRASRRRSRPCTRGTRRCSRWAAPASPSSSGPPRRRRPPSRRLAGTDPGGAGDPAAAPPAGLTPGQDSRHRTAGQDSRTGQPDSRRTARTGATGSAVAPVRRLAVRP